MARAATLFEAPQDVGEDVAPVLWCVGDRSIAADSLRLSWAFSRSS
jgi:hypothetical protein